MTRYGYDSVSPGSIPTNAPVVFGYVDGRFAWSPGDWARFTTKTKLRIAVFPSTNDGHILDCEPGDAIPSQCPGWVQMRRAAGIDPTVYTSMSEWGQVIDAFINAGVAQPHYWIAAYPGSGEVQETLRGITSIAHQFADPPNSGGNFDKSVVIDVWPGVDTPNNVVLEDYMSRDLVPMRTMGNWLVWVGESEVLDTATQLTSGTWQGVPIGQIDDATLARRRELQAAREDQLLNPAPPASVTIDSAQLALDFPKNWKVVQDDAVTTTVTGS